MTKPKKMPEDYFAGIIPKTQSERLKIGLRSYKGRRALDFRIWRVGADGVAKPSFKGVNIAVEHVDEILRSLRKVQARAKLEGLPTYGGRK
jgi:hypothetical protein